MAKSNTISLQRVRTLLNPKHRDYDRVSVNSEEFKCGCEIKSKGGRNENKGTKGWKKLFVWLIADKPVEDLAALLGNDAGHDQNSLTVGGR